MILITLIIYLSEMGNRQHNGTRQPVPNPRQAHRQLFKCPKCEIVMPPSTTGHNFANHLRACVQVQQYLPEHIAEHPLVNKNDNTQYEKVPVDYSMTKFKWTKVPVMALDDNILTLTASEVKKLSFQEKEHWFRRKLEQNRISWQNGADWMKLERSNILMSSLVEYKKVNMHKEVKIEFLGEKVSDAGGLLREWIHMVTKEVFDDSTGIFAVANTEQIMYKLKWDEDLDEEFSTQLFQIFGTILGKSIFERIPMQSYLDRTILRQICGQDVKMEDIYGYDVDLYKNWTFTLESKHLDDLEIYFVVTKNNGETIKQIELVPGGSNIQINQKNKFQYVDSCIQLYTMEKVKRSIECISTGIHRVIPPQLLTIFEPFEFEMLLYGVPFIDLAEWRRNTVYKSPYGPNNAVIEWFWQTMEKFDQDQLANILHFCTGSSRTPIHGFDKLESNRGNYSKFMIEGTKFEKANPYPKGHTCFNRLELPMYPDQVTLSTYLTAISKSNLDGIFGLD